MKEISFVEAKMIIFVKNLNEIMNFHKTAYFIPFPHQNSITREVLLTHNSILKIGANLKFKKYILG